MNGEIYGLICEASQFSDKMKCQRCGLYWEVNDPDRPQCLTDSEVSHHDDPRGEYMPRTSSDD